MKRFGRVARLVQTFFGCNGRKHLDFEDGFCEHNGCVEGPRFFISLESRDNRFPASVPEILTCPAWER
ncbi:MAG: hypothetical protein M0Q37_01500 [Sphaerochaeta sp.]|jgi:hypothetical protein|nr:hypothetical protein [Sphaerochaeta sp.]